MTKRRGVNIGNVSASLSGAHVAELNKLSPGLGSALQSSLSSLANAHQALSGTKGPVELSKQQGKSATGITDPALILNNDRITGVQDPIADQDVATKRWVQRKLACQNLVKILHECQPIPPRARSADRLTTPGTGSGACVTPQLVLAASISTGANPGALSLVDLAVRGDYLYTIGPDGNNGHVHFQVYFIRDPASAKRVANLDIGTVTINDCWIDVRGRFAYVATSNAGHIRMLIFDVTRADDPRFISQTDFSSQTNFGLGISVEGKFAYVSTFNNSSNLNSVALIDVSDPQAPRLVSLADGQIIGATGFGNQALIRGDRLYFCDPSVLSGGTSGFFDIINVADPNPGGPFIEGSVPLTAHRPSGVWVDGRYAYVTGDNQNDVSSSLSVIDIIDPTNPQIVSTFPIISHGGALCGGGVSGVGNHVFISGEPSPLLDIDVSDRSNPNLIASGEDAPAPFISTSQSAVQGRYVWTLEQRLGTPILPPNVVAYNIGGFLCEEIQTSGLEVDGQGVFQTVRSRQGDFSEAITCGDLVIANGYPVERQPNDPTVNDIGVERFRVWKNTTTGLIKIWTNDAGVLKSLGPFI